ncbi:MAG: hypothetical protein ABIS50_23845 [Luteolibacter sp.]|uniref:hypothetical protein n=1 Tax=Luteolibacter sp. TaxID=1962973 RepID=UPI003266F7AB
MYGLIHHPLLVFAVSLLLLWLSARLGRRLIGRQCQLEEELRADFVVILGATLTLLGLIIGFSFSMAMVRYDLHKGREAAEAIAIETEYVRAGLLPASDAEKLRTMLKLYLGERINFYQTAGDSELRSIAARTAVLEAGMWSCVMTAADARPTPVIALTVSGLNDVLNSQRFTQAGYWNRIPLAAWGMMGVIGIGCNMLVGYGSRSLTARSCMLHVLPVLVSISFMFIADIDSPRHGIVRVLPQNLTNLAGSLS